MSSNARPWLVFLAGILFAIPISAHADQRSDAVDKLFERWKPNNAWLVYPIGSISKQFVGYCVQLLAREGKLSLTDNVRRYLPEMHDFGDPITLEMLLTHTSGVRDNVSLLIAKGRRVDDVIQEQESFDIITRQTGLNFRPVPALVTAMRTMFSWQKWSSAFLACPLLRSCNNGSLIRWGRRTRRGLSDWSSV